MCPARIGTGWEGAETLDTVLEYTHCTAVLLKTLLDGTHRTDVLLKNILEVNHCTAVLLNTILVSVYFKV